jgi:hypothetical protein
LSCCPHCGGSLPSPKLLDPLPGELEGEYAARMRREWKRETREKPRRARSSQSEEEEIEDIRAVLGAR